MAGADVSEESELEVEEGEQFKLQNFRRKASVW